MTMKIHIILSCVFVLLLSIFSPYSDAGAFRADIMPNVISPGDSFVVRLTGTRDAEIPSAVLNDRQLHFDICGERCYMAVGAVDIETKPGVSVIRLRADKKKINLKLTVRKPNFPLLHLTLAEEKVFPIPADLERAEREDMRLKSLWEMESDRLWQGDFILPLKNEISTVFGTKRIMNQKKVSIHRGMDIRGKDGEEVRASNRGRVVLSEELFFGGNTVILDHGRSIFTVYMHLSVMNVKAGDIVSKDDVVGLVGSSGRASGPHLHFGVKFQDISVNPASLIRLKM
jgi:murein DD-endopeptidase MepM/ murein hydrolase activator NlpD